MIASNSKASYLPRQPRDKLHSDPDHGSYKLTLTSNEDCINHNSGSTTTGPTGATGGHDGFPEEIIASPKCNLPDVLPPGVKYSLYSTTTTTTATNNNNNSVNNNNSINNHHNGVGLMKAKHAGPHSAPIISTAHSLKSLFNFGSTASSDSKDQMPSPPALVFNGNGNASPPLAQIQATSPKYTSQSSFDLKKTQILDTGAADAHCNGGGYHLHNGGLGIPSTPTTHSGATATLTSIASINHTVVEADGTTTNTSSSSSSCASFAAPDDPVPPPLPSTPSPALNGSTGCMWPQPASAPTVNNCTDHSENSTIFEQHQYHHETSSTTTTTTAASTVGTPTIVEQREPDVDSAAAAVAATTDSEASSVSTSTRDDASALSSGDATTNRSSFQHPSPAAVVVPKEAAGEAERSNSAGPGLERVTREIHLANGALGEEHQTPAHLQRTEIVLRVQAPTSEASSQTDGDDAIVLGGSGLAELTIECGGKRREQPNTVSSPSQQATNGTATVATSTTSSPPGTPPVSPPSGAEPVPPKFFASGASSSPPPPATPRKLHPEEIDCDKLSHDLVSQLSPSDKLHTILAPKTFKSSSDYVSDLFNIQIAPRPLKKDASTATPPTEATGGGTPKSPLDILTSSSTYFQISEPKAKLMTRYSREMTLINGDCCDLTKKKEELVQRLGKKLLVLTNEQTNIAEESNANDLLGNDVALKVTQKVRPADASKFRSYVDDVGYITMLLLSLSGRLARTDNALHTIDANHPDKKILEAKRDRLLEQLDEAKQLKDDIDQRGATIARILEQSLTIEEYADYDYFINMKAKLIVDSREIADKIKLGEEQLAALKDTLVQSEC
uniref:ASD2 domain-containing protein n=1 Tax=Anopheles dirus TaxID=7168 RepID=A0A182NU36_9DIPT